MSWLKCWLTGEVGGGVINARISRGELIEGGRPTQVSELWGLDSVSKGYRFSLRLLKERQGGFVADYPLPVWVGAASAILIDRSKVRLDENYLKKLEAKFGPLGHAGILSGSLALLAEWRNLRAGGVWSCAHLAGGMSEGEPWQETLAQEITEIGLRDTKGWYRYRLPEPFNQPRLQQVLDQAQESAWQARVPGLPAVGELALELFSPLGAMRDSLNETPCLLTVGPLADLAPVFAFVVKIMADQNEPLTVVDLEVDRQGMPLARHPRLIVPRAGGSPLMIELDDNGIDSNGTHVPLSGEALEQLVSPHMVRPLLGRLGWL